MHFQFTIYIDANIIRTIFVSRLQRASLVSLRAAQPHALSSFISRKLQSYAKFIALVVNRRRAGLADRKFNLALYVSSFLRNIANEK